VHMFHTLGVMKNRVAQSEAEKEGSYREQGERQVIARADRLIVATLAEQTQLQWLYKADTHKMSVIPPGVDTSHFYSIPDDEAKQFIGLEKNARIVLYVGRIEPLKGVDTLIRAISCLQVRDLDGPIYLVIIGGDPEADSQEMDAEMSRLQKLCDDLCLGKMVVFLGKREQDTLPYYYSAAEVVVVPSHYESFGMVALEAMACGTPVIASQVGGLAFLVKDGETGYHVPDDRPDVLCEKLTALLGDAGLRAQMGRQAADYAQDYDWGKIAPQVVGVYEGLLHKQSENKHKTAGQHAQAF
jgi:D-inositol-3-phosphate glycosyltransferase